MRPYFFWGIIVILIIILGAGYYESLNYLWWLILALPLAAVIFYDSFQKEQVVWRNFPLIGHLKDVLTGQRHLWQEWLFENDYEGRPFANWQREIVIRRSDGIRMDAPFGTVLDVDKNGYEWIVHSVHPAKRIEEDLRLTIGGKDCKKPYSASILNVSAMSYGSISANAIEALNGGAKIGKFAHNTGEGGLADCFIKSGADLIFQFGTGYFGCRDADGNFN